VELIGRLALFGPAAARLHEEILPVTAFWNEGARSGQGLRVFGAAGEETTLSELEQALKDASTPPHEVVDRLLAGVRKDVAGPAPGAR
jgi:hypothetical protein